MGLSVSLLLSAWREILRHGFFSFAYNISLDTKDGEVTVRVNSFKKTEDSEVDVTSDESHDHDETKSLKNYKPENVKLFETNLSFKDLADGDSKETMMMGGTASNTLKHKPMPTLSLPETAILFSPRPVKELDAAAVKLQKVYKSYRTRRNLADCAVVVEELW